MKIEIEKSQSGKGYRDYALTIPEDAISADELKERLEDMAIPACFILHDKDTVSILDVERYPDRTKEVGEEKFPHFHLILSFSNQKAESRAIQIAERLNAIYIKNIYDKAGCFNYLTHKKQPTKYRYNDDEIVFVNGFTVPEESETRDAATIEHDIFEFIEQNSIREYYHLIKRLYETGRYTEAGYVKKQSAHWNNILRSKKLSSPIDDFTEFEKFRNETLQGEVKQSEINYEILERLEEMQEKFAEFELLQQGYVLDEVTGEYVQKDVMLGA